MAFLIVGIADIFFDEAVKKIKADLKGQAIFAAPLRRNIAGNYSVAQSDCEKALGSIKKAIVGDPASLNDGLGVVVLRRPWEDQRFAELFFPFGLVRHVVTAAPVQRGRLAREVANSTAKAVAQSIRSLLEPIGAVKNRFDTTSGRTRMLLPLKNFQCPVLRDEILDLSRQLPTAADPKALLRNFDDRLDASVPLRRDAAKGSYFEDGKGTWFKTPGRALHGKVWLEQLATGHAKVSGADAHGDSCHLSAKLRLGGVIADGFHFDCTAGNGRLAGDFEICHAFTARFRGDPHLNIYVNDFIRA